nr:FixH family protein [Novosphingobium sp.]
MRQNFTGRHMTGILVGGFAVVAGVNVLMASLAIRSFGGVVVQNSYVASQDFNRWLAEADREDALGWKATVSRAGDGRLEVVARSVPAGTSASVELRHPLGREDRHHWLLAPQGSGRYLSVDKVPDGRWLVRLTLRHGAKRMQLERPVG